MVESRLTWPALATLSLLVALSWATSRAQEAQAAAHHVGLEQCAGSRRLLELDEALARPDGAVALASTLLALALGPWAVGWPRRVGPAAVLGLTAAGALVLGAELVSWIPDFEADRPADPDSVGMCANALLGPVWGPGQALLCGLDLAVRVGCVAWTAATPTVLRLAPGSAAQEAVRLLVASAPIVVMSVVIWGDELAGGPLGASPLGPEAAVPLLALVVLFTFAVIRAVVRPRQGPGGGAPERSLSSPP